MKKFLALILIVSAVSTNTLAQTKIIGGLSAKQAMQFLANGNEKEVYGGLTPSGLKQFLASDEKHNFSGVTPSQFWKFLAEGYPVKPTKKSKSSK